MLPALDFTLTDIFSLGIFYILGVLAGGNKGIGEGCAKVCYIQQPDKSIAW